MKPKVSTANQMRAEYDFSKGVRGKYHKRLLKEGSNVVVLEPETSVLIGGHRHVNHAPELLLAEM